MKKHSEVLRSFGELEIGKDEEIVILVKKHNSNDWSKVVSVENPISFFLQGTLQLKWDFDNKAKRLENKLKEIEGEGGLL